MSAVQCLSCDHENQLGAKFCQECGSPLNLKLCTHCEAINEANAQRCHSCATQFPAHLTHPQPEEAGRPSRRFAAWRIGSSRVLWSALSVCAIAVGGAYFLYAQPGPDRSALKPAAPDSARASASRPDAQPAPEPVTAKPALTNVSAPAVPLRKTSPAAAPTASGTADRPVPLPVRVTHTKSAVAAPLPARQVKQAAPVTNDTTAPQDTMISAPSPARSTVTHTKRAAAPAQAGD